MTLSELKQFVENRLNALRSEKERAKSQGDLEAFARPDKEIAETEQTLEALG